MSLSHLLHLLAIGASGRRERRAQLRVLHWLVAYDRERAAWERLACLEHCTRFRYRRGRG